MRILILTNHQAGLYNFRKELLERLVSSTHEVYVSVPDGDYTDELNKLGVSVISNIYLDRRGTNPFNDFKLVRYYKRLLNRLSPDAVLTYTVKPNVYGGYICGKMKIPYIANVTGLGTSIENKGFLQFITLKLYKLGLRKAYKIFFQNKNNREYMLERKIVKMNKSEVLPGSGVNLMDHPYEKYPESDDRVIFTTIGRIMRDKGIFEILDVAKEIKQKYPYTLFRIIGDYDEDLKQTIDKAVTEGIIEYIPFQKNVQSFIRETHAILHASYHEGMSNVLLEAASSGRPIIATDIPGCIETFDPGITGISFKAMDKDSMIEAIREFLSMSHSEKERMGAAGRRKVLKEFDREIVINAYLRELNKLIDE